MLVTCPHSTRAGRGRDERKGLGVAGAVVSDWAGRLPATQRCVMIAVASGLS